MIALDPRRDRLGGRRRAAPRRHGCRRRHDRRRHRRRPTPVRSAGGDVFFAKRGEFDDGHRFAPAAVEPGRGPRSSSSTRSTCAVPQLVVADTVDALGALATEVVRARPRAAASCGSSASPARTARRRRRTCSARSSSAVGPHGRAARASFNNEVGATDHDARARPTTPSSSSPRWVRRASARSPGSCAMAHPDVGIVLKVGLAHAGEFGGIEQTVAREVRDGDRARRPTRSRC